MEHDSMTQYDRPKIYSKLGTVPGVRAFFAGNPYKMYSKLGMSIARLYLCVHTVHTKTYIPYIRKRTYLCMFAPGQTQGNITICHELHRTDNYPSKRFSMQIRALKKRRIFHPATKGRGGNVFFCLC